MTSTENQLAEQQTKSWLMLCAGLAIGFVGLHFLVARPMAREMGRMQRDVTQLELRMKEIVGSADAVKTANNLLADLKSQQTQLAEARQSLASIRQLQSELIEVAVQSEAATRSVDEVKSLQSRLIDQQPATEIAESSFGQMKSLQERIATHLESDLLAKTLNEFVALKEQVQGQAQDLQQTRCVVDELMQLNLQLRGQSAEIAQARQNLKGLEELKSGISDAARDLEVAQAVSAQLISLEEQLAQGGERADFARQQADRLISLNQALSRDDLDLNTSGENLAGLLQLQDQLNAQTPRIADAIESLELLNGFHKEFVAQIRVLTEMRRDLVEISLMRTVLDNVTRMLEPLTELGNLRRLSDSDMRQVARQILEGRTTVPVSENREPSIEQASISSVEESTATK